MIKFKVIKPTSTFKRPGEFRQALHAEGLAIMADVMKDFNKTTETWTHGVQFDGKVQDTSNQVAITVTTKDKIFQYVDQGTKPHTIKPKKKGGLLVFNTKFKSKTKPHVIGSTAGQSKPPVAYAKTVKHPGTDARYFTRDLQAKWQPKIQTRLQAAIDKTAKQTSK